MANEPAKDDEWMKSAGLGWRTRLGLRLGRGEVKDFFANLIKGRPGITRTVLAVYVVAIVALNALGMTDLAATLGGVAAWIGITPESTGMPISQEALTAAVVAVVALLRPFLRWAQGKGETKLPEPPKA